MKWNKLFILVALFFITYQGLSQRSTFHFYKSGSCEIDADELYPIEDTTFYLQSGEMKFVGNYLTITYADGASLFYTITEKRQPVDGEFHYILWNTRETAIAIWHENKSHLTIVSTDKDVKNNSLLSVKYYLTKKMVYSGNNKMPKKGEVKIGTYNEKESVDYY